jgi:hypothetical protein
MRLSYRLVCGIANLLPHDLVQPLRCEISTATAHGDWIYKRHDDDEIKDR